MSHLKNANAAILVLNAMLAARGSNKVLEIAARNGYYCLEFNRDGCSVVVDSNLSAKELHLVIRSMINVLDFISNPVV